MYRKTLVLLDWSIAISSYIATLLTIPLGNFVFGYLEEATVDNVFNFCVNIIVAAIFISVLVILISKRKEARLSSYVWLVVICALSIYFLVNVQVSRDRLHFLGYAVLSLLLYRALRHSVASYMLYLWVLISIMVFSYFDELLQLSGLGGRSFSFLDIRTDCFSAILAQALIALVLRPKLEVVSVKINYYIKKLSLAQKFKDKYIKK